MHLRLSFTIPTQKIYNVLIKMYSTNSFRKLLNKSATECLIHFLSNHPTVKIGLEKMYAVAHYSTQNELEELALCNYSEVIIIAIHFLQPLEAVPIIPKAGFCVTQGIVDQHSHAGVVDGKALVVLPAEQILVLVRVSL